MADIPGWLRGFQRARVANITVPPDGLHVFDEVNEATDESQDAPSTARMSSFQSFGRMAALSLSSSESQPQLNQVEQIWHNPDPDQMAETLKVAMMTQNSFDPLHVHYNSCILHVLEAYHLMRKQLIEKDHEILDWKLRHEKHIREFSQQQLRWNEQEAEYRSELKKLEVMLATGARGLELVTLARSRSALNRTKRGRNRDSDPPEESELQSVAGDEEPMTSDFAEKKDSSRSASYISQRRSLYAGSSYHTIGSLRPHPSKTPIVIDQIPRDTIHGSKTDSAHLHTARKEQLHETIRRETSPCSLFGHEQEAERCTERCGRPFGDLVSDHTYVEWDRKVPASSKPLSGVLVGMRESFAEESNVEKEDMSRLSCGKDLLSGSVIHSRGFSFVPGDDCGRLALGRTPDTALTLDVYGNEEVPLGPRQLATNDLPPATLPPNKQGQIRIVLEEEVDAAAPDPYEGGGGDRGRGRERGRGVEPDKDASGQLYQPRPRRSRVYSSNNNNEAIIAAARALAESGKTFPRTR